MRKNAVAVAVVGLQLLFIYGSVHYHAGKAGVLCLLRGVRAEPDRDICLGIVVGIHIYAEQISDVEQFAKRVEILVEVLDSRFVAQIDVLGISYCDLRDVLYLRLKVFQGAFIDYIVREEQDDKIQQQDEGRHDQAYFEEE